VHLAEDGIKSGGVHRSDSNGGGVGVKITIDREIGYDESERYNRK